MALDLSFAITLLVVFVLTTIPLHLAVKLLGGRTTFFKTFLVLLISGLIVVIITTFFPWGGIIAFIILIWIYSEMFHIGMLRAFFVWITQAIIIFLLTLILAFAGFSFITLNFLF
jgi:hypothetical protein